MKKILVILGASGSGKSTIGSYLTEAYGIQKLVTTTTRKPREGEVNGVDYYFVDEGVFKSLDKVEWAEYGGNFYGLTREEIDNKLAVQDTVYVILEISGLMALKGLYPGQVLSVYADVSLDSMYKRMLLRGDLLEDVAIRVSNAILSGELENCTCCDCIIKEGSLWDVHKALDKLIKSKKLLVSLNKDKGV